MPASMLASSTLSHRLRTGPARRNYCARRNPSVHAAGKPVAINPQVLVYVPPHPLVKHWLAVLRNAGTPPSLFRNAMAELGRILIYEAVRDFLPTRQAVIETPLSEADVEFIDPERPIKPTMYLNKLPKTLSENDLILVTDPMLATGGTMVAVLEDIFARGAKPHNTRVVAVVAAPPALKAMSQKFPGMKVYTAIIDEVVDERGYILPGLGDAGDRAFGTAH